MTLDNLNKKHERNLWIISISITLFFLMIIAVMWYVIDNRYTPSPNQVSSSKELNEKVQFIKSANPKELIFIPTGIFIQSFEFLTSDTVQVSGYVWQKINNSDLKKGIIPGIIFPEAKSKTEMYKAYDLDFDQYRVIGWHFHGVTLLQSFNYSNYPFDIQSIWVRMWPRDFYNNIILIPDLKAYDSTNPGDVFGLEENIVKQGYEFKETYFDMPIIQYDTNFGLPNFLKKNNSLELYFNIIVKRHLINAFLIHLLPIVVIWCILFATTMIITNDEHFAQRVGLSTMQIFIALGGTVFSVILMNNNLRSAYEDQPVLYLEYFYLMTYFIIMLVSYDAYMITTRSYYHKALKHNLLPKTLFWPVILAMIIIITLLEFFIFPESAVHWHGS